MNEKTLQQLMSAYNTLHGMTVTGDSIFIMATALTTLRSVIEEMAAKLRDASAGFSIDKDGTVHIRNAQLTINSTREPLFMTKQLVSPSKKAHVKSDLEKLLETFDRSGIRRSFTRF